MTVNISTLSNGLRVVSQAMPHLETVSLGLFVARGARHERPKEHGVSHFLEHMAFKGTPSRDARAIADEIAGIGGDINAATSMESTDYYARVLKGDEHVALRVIADIVQNPLLSTDEIEREREVILQEIAAAQDVPEDVVYDLSDEAAFGDQPIGRPILGTKESVRGFAKRDLSGFLTRNYKAGEIVLSAAGAVDYKRLVKLAEAELSGFPEGTGPAVKRAAYVGGERSLQRDYEQSHLVLGFEGPGLDSQSYFAAQVLSGLFGGGMSSRLFQEARENRGLCYSIYSFASGFTDTGFFGIHAATGADEVAELVEVIAKEIGKILDGDMTDAEIARSKAQLKVQMLTGLESSGARSEQLARHLAVFGRVLPAAEIMRAIERVTKSELEDLSLAIFRGSAPAWSEVGPKIDRSRYQAFTRLLDQKLPGKPLRKLPGARQKAGRFAPLRPAA